ncbi:N-methylhydantoinase B [Paracoccus denitrificans]|nr:N-methylhydantoinase B [Paracoccus denitrificans]
MVISTLGMAMAQNQGLAGGHPGNTGHNVVMRNAGLDELFSAGRMPADLDELGDCAEVIQCMAGGLLNPG